MRICLTIALTLILIGGNLPSDAPGTPADADRPTTFAPPEVILDATGYGRLFPAFADIDGDGKLDLVVGVPGQKSRPNGRLLVYLNRGMKARPKYAKPRRLDETTPTARIPDG
jgi:hypothetical protein